MGLRRFRSDSSFSSFSFCLLPRAYSCRSRSRKRVFRNTIFKTLRDNSTIGKAYKAANTGHNPTIVKDDAPAPRQIDIEDRGFGIFTVD